MNGNVFYHGLGGHAVAGIGGLAQLALAAVVITAVLTVVAWRARHDRDRAGR